MIIECPHCMTRFRLDESRVSGLSPLLKCSRCQHIFPLPGAAPAAAPPVQPPPPVEPKPPARNVRPARTDNANLSFDFGSDEDQWETDSAGDDAVVEQPFSLTNADNLKGEATSRSPGRDTPFVDETDSDAGQRHPRAAGSAISLRPVIVFLFLVVGGYAALAGTLYANPGFTDQIVHDVPMVGTGSGGLLNRQVLLIDIEGGYERTKAGKDIFVVTGYAVNHAEFSLSSIQVRVQLLDSGGSPLHDRIVFCGSTVPRKLLRELTVPEVSVLGRLKPPRTLLIHPGERSPFMAVFAEPLPAVTELSTRVAAAQRQP
jgi:predicted Zn finger-like uncharacterized protein